MTKKPPPTDKGETLTALLAKRAPELSRIAGRQFDMKKLLNIVLAARSRNPDLLECTPASFLQFCIRCAETGTQTIGAGGAWPVPFKNKDTNAVEVQFIVDYRRMGNAAIEASAIKHYYVNLVYEQDEFSMERGLHPSLVHKPTLGHGGQCIGGYLVIVLPDGDRDFTWLSEAELIKIRGSSKAKHGPWTEWPDEMRKKSIVRRGMKPFQGRSAALDKLIEYDDDSVGIELAPRERAPISMPREVTGDGDNNHGGDGNTQSRSDELYAMNHKTLCGLALNFSGDQRNAAYDALHQNSEVTLIVPPDDAIRTSTLEGRRTLCEMLLWLEAGEEPR